jgi:acyl transferase domain-containing protein
VVDTACSSALVAMSLAINDLVNGEIESATVAGVSLLTNDDVYKMFQERNILSPEKSFHIFDKRSSGVVVGEGAGLVLLKTVEQAEKDGDYIYARIKGLSVNNDGRTAGPATPSIEAQKAVMESALRKSGKGPEEISYIEANASGSEVTDLLELKAIEAIYRSSSNLSCRLGSVKPNIGHLLSAEGIAGFIKVVLMLDNRENVPFLSGEQAMTHYDLISSPFKFDRNYGDWIEKDHLAGLNCFADGGTNVHVILEGDVRNVTTMPERKSLKAPELNRVNVTGEIFPKDVHKENKNFWF